MKNIALIAAVLFASSGFAHAEEVTTDRGPTPLVKLVPYQSSELATDSSIRDLRFHVRQAANRICAPGPDAFMETYNEWNCTRRALDDAYAQIDSAVTRQRSGIQASADNIPVRAR
jgi:UrcA family protein